MSIDPVFARNPKEAEAFGRTHVAIVGLGSVGSALALMCARAGIGRFTLIDPDTLALENVGRHMLARENVGKPKVEGVRDAIAAVNPAALVETHACDFVASDLPAGWEQSPPDLLIADTDSFQCQSRANGVVRELDIPALFVGCWGEASIGEVLYVVPGKTPCFECYAGFRRGTVPLPDGDPRRYTDPRFDGTKVPGQAGLWPNILMISSVAFQVALGLLDPAGDRAHQLLDYNHTLFVVNVSAYDSPLQPLAVTFGRVARGCAVCDDSRLLDLGAGLREQATELLGSLLRDDEEGADHAPQRPPAS